MNGKFLIKISEYCLLLLLTKQLSIWAEIIIEELSCDFNDATLCNWIYHAESGDAQFIPIFNRTNFYDNNDDNIDDIKDYINPDKGLFYY